MQKGQELEWLTAIYCRFMNYGYMICSVNLRKGMAINQLLPDALSEMQINGCSDEKAVLVLKVRMKKLNSIHA